MSSSSDRASDPRRVLRDLIAAFTDPGSVNPALAAQVVDTSRELLSENVVDLRPRMPSLVFPRSAVIEVPDRPPVPPAAL